MTAFTVSSSEWNQIGTALKERPPFLVAPRFHSNLSGWREMFEVSGIPFVALVARDSELENYGATTVIKIKGWLPGKKSRGQFDDWRRWRWFIPSLRQLWETFEEAEGKTLIVRDRTVFSRLSFLVYRMRGGFFAFLYVQEVEPNVLPHQRRFLGWAIKIWEKLRRKTFLPSRQISPIWEAGTMPKVPKNVPFLVEQRFFGVGETRFSSEWPRRRARIIVVGKYRPYKRLHELVEWLSLEPTVVGQFSGLTIVGQCISPEEKEFKKRLSREVAALGLQDFICLKENISHSQMHHVYANHDVFLLSSDGEVASISVLEAAAAGLATLTPFSNGTSCYFSQATDLLFSWQLTDDLAQKLRRLGSEYTYLRRCAEASFRIAKSCKTRLI